MEMISAVSRETGKIGVSAGKRGMVFDLASPIGVITIVVSDDNHLDSLIRCLTISLLAGNAIMISTSTGLGPLAQSLAK